MLSMSVTLPMHIDTAQWYLHSIVGKAIRRIFVHV
jgi:hypothetical protein